MYLYYMMFVDLRFLMTNLYLYIDPGSGSLLLQFIIGIVLGVSMFFKVIKYKIMSFFGGKKNKQDA